MSKETFLHGSIFPLKGLSPSFVALFNVSHQHKLRFDKTPGRGQTVQLMADDRINGHVSSAIHFLALVN